MVEKMKIRNLVCKGLVKLELALESIRMRFINFCKKEQSANEQLIVALVMIAISVALVLIFKDKISTLLNNFMTNVTTKINTALGV